jgi:hypothetical protein
MKRIIVVLIAALAFAGVAAAQSAPPPPAPSQAQTVKVSGKLELIDGAIGFKAGGKTYFVPRLRELIGFVKDLQEGALVTVEGYERPFPHDSTVSLLMVTKLSFGGKDYDLSHKAGPGTRWGMGRGKRGGMGGGPRW